MKRYSTFISARHTHKPPHTQMYVYTHFRHTKTHGPVTAANFVEPSRRQKQHFPCSLSLTHTHTFRSARANARTYGICTHDQDQVRLKHQESFNNPLATVREGGRERARKDRRLFCLCLSVYVSPSSSCAWRSPFFPPLPPPGLSSSLSSPFHPTTDLCSLLPPLFLTTPPPTKSIPCAALPLPSNCLPSHQRRVRKRSGRHGGRREISASPSAFAPFPPLQRLHDNPQ